MIKYLWFLLLMSASCLAADQLPKAREVNPDTGYPYYDEDEPKPVGVVYHIRYKNALPQSKG